MGFTSLKKQRHSKELIDPLHFIYQLNKKQIVSIHDI